MRIAQGLLIAFPALCLGACTPNVRTVVKTVEVPVKQIVAVPNELTKPCPIAEPKDMSVAEAVRVARARKDSLNQCNYQLGQIKKLGGDKN